MKRESTFDNLIAPLHEACLVVSPSGDIIAANRSAHDLYGFGDAEMIGRDLGDLCAETERHAVAGAISATTSTHELTAHQLRHDGTTFLGKLTATRECVEEDDHEVLVLRVRKLRENLKACRSDLELHHLLLEHSVDAILAHTLAGDLLYANAAARQLWDMSDEEVSGLGRWGWVLDDVRPDIEGRVDELLEKGRSCFESHGVGRNGRQFHNEIHASLVQSTQGPIVVAVIRDISARLETEDMVRYLAYHDMLTGLANRVLLDQELAHAISNAERHCDHLGLIFIDLDDFKPVNDTYGHFVGDQVLREVANRLAGAVREGDTVSRVGGDEFVVVLPRLSSPQDLDAVAEKLLSEVASPMNVIGIQLSVTASVGLAIYEPGDDAAAMMTRADLNMYIARENRGHARHVQAG